MPMPTHVAMPNLSAALFERWLALFGQTTAALPNRPMADAAMQMAQRMARSLWYGYQLSRDPSLPLAELRPATPPLTTAGQHSAAFPANRAQRSVHQAGSSARLARR